MGLANGWLIRSPACAAADRRAGAVLVDAGFARREGRVAYALRAMGLGPRDLRLIILTHVHLDHAGSLAAIARATGAEVAVHASEAEFLKTGRTHMPKGLSPRGRLAVAYGLRHPEKTAIEPAAPDILIRGDLDLAPWGLDGRVVETPGHSPGSVSVLLENGAAFVGDLVANSFPRLLGVRASVFGEDPEELRRSWRKLFDLGARMICPGHGEAFDAKRLARLLESRG